MAGYLPSSSDRSFKRRSCLGLAVLGRISTFSATHELSLAYESLLIKNFQAIAIDWMQVNSLLKLSNAPNTPPKITVDLLSYRVHLLYFDYKFNGCVIIIPANINSTDHLFVIWKRRLLYSFSDLQKNHKNSRVSIHCQ